MKGKDLNQDRIDLSFCDAGDHSARATLPGETLPLQNFSIDAAVNTHLIEGYLMENPACPFSGLRQR
jgi:hypothetical protein